MLRPRPAPKIKQAALYIALLAIVIAAMAALSRCDRPVDIADRQSGGDTLDIAIEYAPITFYAYNDTIGGLDHDLLQLIASHSGRAIKFHPITTLRQGLKGLNDGTYDLLVAQYPLTEADKSHYLFTDPIYIDRQVLAQRRPAHARTQLDLAGDTVWVVAGSPMKSRIEGLSRELGDTIHVIADTTANAEVLLLRVAAGQIKQAVVNQALAKSLDNRLPNIDASLDISLSQFQSWLIRRDNVALRDSINNLLRQVNNTPQARLIYKRYLNQTQ